jgi:hypothetical protein
MTGNRGVERGPQRGQVQVAVDAAELLASFTHPAAIQRSTMWVRAGTTPHPVHTPCAADRSGSVPMVVTMERVRVLDSRDDDENDPMEIQLAAALSDDLTASTAPTM